MKRERTNSTRLAKTEMTTKGKLNIMMVWSGEKGERMKRVVNVFLLRSLGYPHIFVFGMGEMQLAP